MISAAQTIFAALAGQWTLHRNIPGQGYVDGQVTFTPIDETRLLYEEHGSFHRGGYSNEATRSYIYELKDNKIVIYYNDPARRGDVLHELTFSPEANGFVSRHCHICTPDTYDLVFRFGDNRSIEMFYDIQGPKKDYTMHTSLTRQPS